MTLAYYFVALLVCLLFSVFLAKLDRDNKMNYWVFCGVAITGMVLICLLLRWVAFGF